MKVNRIAGTNGMVSARGGAAADLLVSSRREALKTLRNEVALDGSGLVLLTGESGTGKTWLWRRLSGELPPLWRWLAVDMSSSLDAREFLELIGHGLGVSPGDRLATARLALARALEEESAEGRSWTLVIENAHNVSEQVWTEIAALIHDMEASAGFAALILVGPTELVRLLAQRSRRSLASRFGAHVHLLPLDLDECRELAETAWGPGQVDRTLLEELQRDALGNPRRVLQLLCKRAKNTPAPPPKSSVAAPRKMPELTNLHSVATSGSSTREGPGSGLESASPATEARGGPPRAGNEPPLSAPLVPSRPPLRVEDGLIEVGWEGNLEADVAAQAEISEETVNAGAATAADDQGLFEEETIDDHYAALQAWSEWAKNRGRAGRFDEPVPGREAAGTGPLGQGIEVEPHERETRQALAIRAESEHEHAPYSQLFTRLRQSK